MVKGLSYSLVMHSLSPWQQVMLPVFWASEEGMLTLSLANKFKEEVYGVEYAIEGGVHGEIRLVPLLVGVQMVHALRDCEGSLAQCPTPLGILHLLLTVHIFVLVWTASEFFPLGRSHRGPLHLYVASILLVPLQDQGAFQGFDAPGGAE